MSHQPLPDRACRHALAASLLLLGGLCQAPLAQAEGDAAATPPLAALALASASAPPTPPASGFEAQLLVLVNRHRTAHGLPALQEDGPLTAIAQVQSQAMAGRQRLSHDGFEQRFRQAGGQVCVENLASGYRRAETLLAGWQASPGHDHNLLDARVSHAGIGRTNGFVALIACRFGKP